VYLHSQEPKEHIVSVADTGSCHSREGGNPVFRAVRLFFIDTIFVSLFPQQELYSYPVYTLKSSTVPQTDYYKINTIKSRTMPCVHWRRHFVLNVKIISSDSFDAPLGRQRKHIFQKRMLVWEIMKMRVQRPDGFSLARNNDD
jgi:hypothetical protein